MTFEKYVTDWFHALVEEHEDNEEWCENLFSQLGYDATYLDDGESPYDFLLAMSDENEIYEAMFGYEAKVKCLDDLPDTEDFVKGMLKEVGKDYIEKYDFAEELITDMAVHCTDYTNPIDFFKDLSYGGCKSGMVGMFIYNSDCKKFYIDHIDSMEFYVEDLEEELGEPIRKDKDIPYHYVWMCWLCYEELAYNIARELWEDEF